MKILKSLFIISAFFAVDASARTLDADGALRRALPMQRTVSARSCKSVNQHELAYTAERNSLYVFNRAAGGYIVVAGDDNAEALLAEIPAGTFSADDMPPAAKAWLDGYARQIEWMRNNSVPASVAENYAVEENAMSGEALADLYTRWEAIPPVMSCKYNQTDPYNRKCPRKNGRYCVTGCVPTAMAQIVRTIGYYSGSGVKINNSGDEPVSFDYANTMLDFANMPDVITAASSQKKIDAVADLMVACGLSAEASYDVDKTGGLSSYAVFGLVDHFGFDDYYTRYISRDDMTAADWAKTIYSELELGRPVYYDGYNNDSGHAFVIDGYAPHGLWHVNWGWGGTSDGYFRLSAMFPTSQGTGGSSSHYNWLQCLIKAVPPGADPGYVYPTLGGSISMVGNGVYSVYYQSIGYYNRGITIGAVIVDSDDNRVAQFDFWEDQNVETTAQLRKDNYNFDFTRAELPPGSYRIYPAFGKTGSGRLEITGRYPGRQYFVYLTVTSSGEYIFSNAPVSGPKEGFDLHISGITDDTHLMSGFKSTLSFTVVNNGRSDYFANSWIAMINPVDNSIVCKESAPWINVPAAGNETLSANFSMKADDGSDIASGEYGVVLINKASNEMVTSPAYVTVTDDYPPNSWYEPADFAVTNGSSVPAVIYKGERWQHSPFIRSNITSEVFLYARFYKPASTYSLKSYLLYSGRPGVMYGQLKIDQPVIDMTFGIYDVAYTKSKAISSAPQRVKVGVEINGIFYLPINDREAEVASHPYGEYTGIIDIPDKITVDGSTYAVTTIGSGAFSGSHDIESVIVPASVTDIKFNAFAYCSSIKSILFKTDGLPFQYRNHVAPGLNPDADIYVKSDHYEQGHDILSDYNHVYAMIDGLESKDVTVNGSALMVSLAVTPAHEATNPEFLVEPADSEALNVADVAVASVRPGVVDISITPRKVAEADYLITSSQPSIEPARLHLKVMAATELEELDAGCAGGSVTAIYDLKGHIINAADVKCGQVIIVVTAKGARKIVAD